MDAGGALNMHFRFRHRVKFVVHRHALLDLVDMYAKAQKAQKGRSLTSDGFREDDLGPDVENSRSLNLVPWPQWGQAVTRRFNSDNVSKHWVMTTAGRRCVHMASDPPPGDGHHFDMQDTIPAEHIDQEYSPEVVIDPTLRTWIFYVSLAPYSLILEPTPESETDMMFADSGSEGVSPTHIDDEMINSDGFLYFPTSNRVHAITQPDAGALKRI
jgi:hypothetical protein